MQIRNKKVTDSYKSYKGFYVEKGCHKSIKRKM